MVGDALTVLVTDDDPGVRDLYAYWLADDFDVRTATDGHELLERLSAAIDVVLLDRQMPGPSGTEVARQIDQSGYDPYVVIVSSKPADFDVVSMPIDDYVRKPIEEETLRDAVESCRSQREYEAALDEFFSLTAKLAALEADCDRERLASDERYARLRRRVERKREEVDAALARSDASWVAAFRTLGDPCGPCDAGTSGPPA